MNVRAVGEVQAVVQFHRVRGSITLRQRNWKAGNSLTELTLFQMLPRSGLI